MWVKQCHKPSNHHFYRWDSFTIPSHELWVVYDIVLPTLTHRWYKLQVDPEIWISLAPIGPARVAAGWLGRTGERLRGAAQTPRDVARRRTLYQASQC